MGLNLNEYILKTALYLLKKFRPQRATELKIEGH